MKVTQIIVLCLISLLSSALALSKEKPQSSPWDDDAFKGLEFRSIGPAFMSGRIADIAIHPENDSIWYVAAGSGGVWKTDNAGVTWTSIFDDQGSYSIGSITIDPNNPHTVWVGTGENVGGRHVGFGDGIYRSTDGGKTWKNAGLAKSEHISKIIVHPEDSNIVWVAAQGPLWSPGDERGLYKTTDGGTTWKKTLGNDKWTGVTDIVIDPRNPDRLYAATWDRHRTVAAYVGGGPGTAIYRSEDGGDTWEMLKSGLPEEDMGKIGLALSPQQPDVIYAAIELHRRTGAVYRSTDRGSSWEKRSDTVSGGTGPHYYQELYASPHQFDRLYLMDARMQVSENGGKTFTQVKEEYKHSDNHALAFRKDDPNYLLVGTDGGLYETFDLANNWRFIDNLPLTQFYKLALDDAEPFYNVYGGTQDNSTERGPSRTDNVHGISNADWSIVLDWDGHQPSTEPGNPNILYGERQEGRLSRIDLATGEVLDVQPQPGEGEPTERYNWDAPILVSPHNPKRIHFASQHVWRSDNRGDKWTRISGDLTKNQNRMTLPIRGSEQSWDSSWDLYAMSNYNTITSLAESPKLEGLIYAGTDDGLIQVTQDGGANWRKMDVGSLPGVPETAFVNDIRADLFDADTVYLALDNHKYGDFRPMLLKSENQGRSWKSITGNLPDRLLVWRIVQDHVKKDLLFAATEFGVYFTPNGGKRWTRLEGGIPTISIRDIQIQRREDDLVAASFGRGFYIFDDMSVFRQVSDDTLSAEASLFSTRKAWWYIPRPKLGFSSSRGSQGASHFVAPNPPFGATFTYHLKNGLQTKTEVRQAAEKKRAADKLASRFPGWDAVEAERREPTPKIWLTIRDDSGQVVRRLEGPREKGFHRVAWDLRFPAPHAIPLAEPTPEQAAHPGQGLMAAPGTYTVTLSKQIRDQVIQLTQPQRFEVAQLRKGTLQGASPQDVAKFWRAYESAVRLHTAMQKTLANLLAKIERMNAVIANSTAAAGKLDERLLNLRAEVQDLDQRLNGHRAKQEPGEKADPIVGDRLFAVQLGVGRSTYGPTDTHRRMLDIATQEMNTLQAGIQTSSKKLSDLAKDLIATGAPWLEGEDLPDSL